MLSLPALKEDGKQTNSLKNINDNQNYGNHQVYDYFSVKISRPTIEILFNSEKDERYLYFLRFGYLRRYEGKGDILYVEIPQIKKNIVVYRKPSIRNKNSEKLYLNKKDLPHIPLLEGEENLKLLSLESNLIPKIEHLISLNNLRFLNLYDNKINEIENLQTVPRLQALMLGKNNISKIKNLQCLQEIEVLDLHSNKIKLIENLSCLKKLRILNLANNQITSFVELMNNKNLEDINLRKNLIVSIPNLTLSFEKLKKLNLGKNMISKPEFILEFKKLKRIEELYVEGNPVLSIKDIYKKFCVLPLKFKDQILYEIYKNNISLNINNNSYNGNTISQFKTKIKNGGGVGLKTSIEENNKLELNKNGDTKHLTGNNSFNTNYSSTNNNRKNSGSGNNKSDQDNLSEEERDKLLNQIDTEWKKELRYIINNGFNGYNVKRLKETKMLLCHAEIEREKQLNLFGNAIEVLGYKEFYKQVHTIKFEFINYDIISQSSNIECIKNFINLKHLMFVSNNMHSFYQIIKLENIKGIEYMTIRKNEICNGELLKFFLIYRLQNIKYLNDKEITNKDTLMSKKIFENFDQAISLCENEEQKMKLLNKDNKMRENGSSLNNNKDLDKNEVQSFESKNSFFDFVKKNLMKVLDEIVDQ